MLTCQGFKAPRGAAIVWKASHVVQPLDSQPDAYEISPAIMTESIVSTSARTWVMVLFASLSVKKKDRG